MSNILAGKRLLIVEDEEDLREPLVMEFESLGCQVFQARNGLEGFAIVEREPLDAVISDIRMPGGDGVELLKRIKELNHVFPTVMLITGFSDLSREDAYHLGAEAILSKPFDLDEIDEAVMRILTPKQELWNQSQPNAKINTKIERTFGALDEAVRQGHFGLGRGGFFLKDPHAHPARGEVLSFQIKFESGQILSLGGNGIVRWVRANEEPALPAGWGIEFECLQADVREKIIDLVDSLKVIPFIPRGPYVPGQEAFHQPPQNQ